MRWGGDVKDVIQVMVLVLWRPVAGGWTSGWWWLAAGPGTWLQPLLAAASNLQTRFSDSVVMLPPRQERAGPGFLRIYPVSIPVYLQERIQ